MRSVLVADDPHLLGGVEAVGVALHALALGVPVAQAGAVEEVGELVASPCPRPARARASGTGSRPTAARAGRSAPSRAGTRPASRPAARRRRSRRRACSPARRSTISASQFSSACCSIDGHRRRAARAAPRGATCASDERRRRSSARSSAYASRSPSELGDLLEQRPPERRADDEHLPAGLDADAGVDEQLGELAISRVGHARE